MPSASSSPALENTSERQAALRRYHVLDTAPEKDFDRITSLVAKVCDASTALITLIDEERQWFKSCFNFDARETGISVSFCVHAVHNGEMLVVEDATKDDRFKDNPIVTGPPYIRFYAGAPLTTPEGIHIGSLCIIDYEPKTFDAAQREILERMADVVVNQFELRSAEAQIRQLIDENPQPMYVYAQSDGRIMKANAAAVSQYRYEAQDFAGLTAKDLEAPASHRDPGSVLEIHQRADGSYFPARVREREVLVDGRAAVLATVQPAPLHSPESTAVVVDREGIVRSVSHDDTEDNPLRGMVGTAFEELSNPFDRGRISDALSALMNDERAVISQEVIIETETGSGPYEAHMRPLRSGSGKVVGVSVMLVPLTDSQKPSRTASDMQEADTQDDGFGGDGAAATALDAAADAIDAVSADAAEAETTPESESDPEEANETPPTEELAVPGSAETTGASDATAEDEPTSAPDTLGIETTSAVEEASAEDTESTGEESLETAEEAGPDAAAREETSDKGMSGSFSDTAASSLLRDLRAREKEADERSAPHTKEDA